MSKAATRARPGDAAVIRRYYERRLGPVPAPRARADMLALLGERKALARAAESLANAAVPYSGDPAVKAAIDSVRAVLEGAG
ncbi:MAG TPA: hypothetical protein VGB83_09935 [Actinomycetota bacterium]